MVGSLPFSPSAVSLLLAYDWPYDEPFVDLLDRSLRSRGGRLLPISPKTLPQALTELEQGGYHPRAYLDRASDTDPSFEPLNAWADIHIPLHLNPNPLRRRAWHKTNLHWQFIAAGIHTPYTLAVPSLDRQTEVSSPPDLAALGVPFSIKPDLGGGGWGVVVDARSWEDVLAARRRLPEDKLILQQFIEPAVLGNRRAWFRVLHACGAIAPCWWDDRTRLFGPAVSNQDRDLLNLHPLWEIAAKAARISGLHLFSTEVARVADGRFIAVDYVNDPVDLRFQPHAREGMPQQLAALLAEAIASYVLPSASVGEVIPSP